MRFIQLTADLGEGGPDRDLLDLIDAASICCGAHAGDPRASVDLALRCLESGVSVGAHPGYPDRAGFGRVEVPMSEAEIEALLLDQTEILTSVVTCAYIKPHGALYHRCARDDRAAAALCRVAQRLDLAVVAQPGSQVGNLAPGMGVPFLAEAFADRVYGPDGLLLSRSEPGAMLALDEVAAQAVRLAGSGLFDTLCVHGDSELAPLVARAVRDGLTRSGLGSGRSAHS